MVNNDFAVRCRGVVKRFGDVAAVNGFDLEVTTGQVLALLGPSGCGKTTALRVIAGLDVSDEGSIEVGGRLVAGPGVNLPPEKRRVGMVFQDFALFPHLDVAANVAFGLPRGDKKTRVAELLSLVRLDGLADRMPHELSGGQQQRVALARALAAEPDLILMDEPFSNLDPGIREEVRGEVRQLLRAVGITAIIVTHDQEEALSLAGEVAVMIDGRVLQTGTPAEVYGRPVSRLVGEFVGAANVLPGDSDGAQVECVLGRFKAMEQRGPVDVMFRAEALAISEDGGIPGEVVDVDYYGHDQMVAVKLHSGETLRVRLLARPGFEIGQRVGVTARGEPFVFPRS
ncbi:MAG TPA: ABC transporter ATP-binding protein [Dehalococcoidia bacterium]|nr:ABC transporter ATP-binding protein [Dehalococcoidia bacterium]